MSQSLDKQEEARIIGLATGKLSPQQFLEQTCQNEEQASDSGHRLLLDAEKSHGNDLVEFGLILGFQFGLEAQYHSVLRRLLEAPWHTHHEQVLNALVTLVDAGDAQVLFRAATAEYPYRTWDNAESIRSKCVHKLAKLRTDESQFLMITLAAHPSQYLSSLAARLLT